jgi:hypothetical protein
VPAAPAAVVEAGTTVWGVTVDELSVVFPVWATMQPAVTSTRITAVDKRSVRRYLIAEQQIF